MPDSDGLQGPDSKCIDGSDFIQKKSGELVRVNWSAWAEKWYENGHIWIKSYHVGT